MAMFQKFSPTWNHITKMKQTRLASSILNKSNQVHFLSPNSTCLSVNNLDYCKKWRLPFESNLSRHSLVTAPSFNYVKTEHRGEGNKVGLVIIDRPNVLNALNSDVTSEIVEALISFDKDPKIGAIVLTGSEKAFAAGADIKELASGTGFSDVYSSNKFRKGESITSITKPIIAAVNGFALGGGCELVMLCDIIIAGEKAKFGQLEINLGIIPGGGGTQRLTHAVGKSRAMQICLTGEIITAQQAVSWGLVNSVHPPEKLIDAAVEIGDQITRQSKIITRMVKESINNGKCLWNVFLKWGPLLLFAFELTLQEGLEAEYRISYSTYATDDIKEGMRAFIEKRKPSFTDK